ncbi:hypothetical protein D7319_15310 [Streptomyces radicis]|uniref:Uncharacterized protein n=1 Tax=Streptomyces radicis TaxID=1750517 RepID=A0A3A9W6F4_9ACTN|nr:hypothetical protein D7319_15310 [Streptomyces radicis]RKN21906.1 hypothetical protein D7318_16265 [Streptomyces radicis]
MSEITGGVLSGSQATISYSPDDSPCGTTSARKVFKSTQTMPARTACDRVFRSFSPHFAHLSRGRTSRGPESLPAASHRDTDHGGVTDAQRRPRPRTRAHLSDPGTHKPFLDLADLKW